MYLTRKSISRRAVLRGVGVTAALPLLDAMTPAASAAPAKKVRLVCMEMVHGAAGSAQQGIDRNLWSPAAVGRGFDLSPTSLRSLEPYRDYLTIVSGTEVGCAEAFDVKELGG